MQGWHPAHERLSPALELSGEKHQAGASTQRPAVCWPVAVRQVRAWLEPWIMLGRYWRAWSQQPPPPELQALFSWVEHGFPLYLDVPL